MRIVCIGGGPAGLYFAILMKKANLAHEITVLERNAPEQIFGWGVVFSDETLSYLEEADRESYVYITRTFAHWDAIDVHYRGTVVRSGGHGFSGISRRALLEILRRRADDLGVTVRYGEDVDDVESLRREFDLVVAADGVNSKTRALYQEHLCPSVEPRSSRYIWLGTRRKFDAFTFLFEECEAGLFQVHAYRFDAETSTFIVETDPATHERAGLGRMSEAEQLSFLEQLFARHLNGEKLLSNRSAWLHFNTLRCERWSHGNVVLLGDAAHSAHFSIGSGTKLAMEDSIALAAALASAQEKAGSLPEALRLYEQERRPTVEKTQAVAQDSLLFFEHTRRYLSFDPLKFSFRLLTRSKKIGYDNLAVRDPGFVRRVTGAFADEARAHGAPGYPEGEAPPPMFMPFSLRGMRLQNRVVVSPMCMYSATDGTVGDFHLVHYGSRAIGGAGLVITEMTDVSREGRITLGCAGMYLPEHVVAWRRITDFVHSQSSAKIALQLAHAGRKGATKLMWEGIDEPLPEGAWPILSASPLPYFPRSQVPKEMDRGDMDRVTGDFVRAARMAEEAGFDMLELHMGHGYLLASFLSPLTNVRADAYGGSLENRLRYPLEVFRAVRAAWPEDRPMSVRFSATDWAPHGTTGDDAVAIARALRDVGCDIVDVSTGQTVASGRPAFYGRMYQAPWSDQIRNEIAMPTMTVGNVTTVDQVNTLLAAGRADLVVLARTHLRDPYFTMHAAEEAGVGELAWPRPYGVVRPTKKETKS